nr:junctional protein associated with coronary artery disease isoform X2 [Pelodiscus sinensis]|eukprot:XP_006110709.1 junctional protein associated with coronary artery disease isoform X2 [Pelodiscus sinensis]
MRMRISGGAYTSRLSLEWRRWLLTTSLKFYDRPQLAWSSGPKTDKDLAYWRRRGQDFSVLLGYTDKGDSEMKGLAPPHGVYRHAKESQLDVGAGTENVTRSGLQETWKAPGDYKWQSLRTESWKQPKTLGRQMSEGDREKLLQDLYSLTLGDNILSSQDKGKSQSLPRVLSPETLKCVEIPSLVNNHHFLSGTKAPSGPQNRLPLELAKPRETGSHLLPLAKPKYGRPLKPPSYELHRQSRASIETSGLQDHQQTEEPSSCLAKGNELKQDISIPDPGLEPPVYVPPPSYKSPPPLSVNQHSLSEVPNYDLYFDSSQWHPVERTVVSHPPSTSTLETGGEHCKDDHHPHGKQSHSRHTDDYLHSIQYIPFDDPRIRHIKIAHPESLQDNTKYTENTCRTIPTAFQERAIELSNSAFLDPSSLLNTVKGERMPDSTTHSNRWLAASNRDQENWAQPDQRDGRDTGNHLSMNETNQEYTKGNLSVRNPHMDSTCETVTRVKKFEPGTGMQTKKSSKKKMNETIFCLVSIPVKSESNLPDTDRNNNLTQSLDKKNEFDNNGALQEQSLLSMSSTDLELQALTGSMTNKTELQKQELWKPEEFKQMNDLSFTQTTKHRELKYSGSWPGDQYKDQQTQTCFTEDPKSSRFFHGIKPEQPNNKLMSPKFLSCTTSVAGSDQADLPPNNRRCRQNTYNMKGQMNLSPSSNSAFSRTATSVIQVHSPKAYQSQPYGSCTNLPTQEGEIGAIGTGDVVKGERSAPCNSKELFGQFLLKPVGRRPWDAISELESFNKELQGQEESTSSEDGVESEGTKQESVPTNTGTFTTCESTQELRPCKKLKTVVPEVPVFRQGRVKSKSESWSTEFKSDDPYICAGSQSSLSAKENSSLVRPADGSVITKKQEAKNRINKHGASLGPVRRVLSSSPSNVHPSNPFNHVDLETKDDRHYIANILDFVKWNKSSSPRNDKPLERGSIVRLSLTNRNQGHSEPDLRSVGLDIDSEPGVKNSDFSANAMEIPPNESLQARAARILGIEVAVESLIPGDKTGLHQNPSPANGVQDPELPVSGTVCDKVETKDCSYEGRRKCGWTESSFFVGERNVSFWTGDRQSTDQETNSKTLITEQGFEPYIGPNRQEKDPDQPCKSVTHQLAERNVIIPSSEKRVRSTSKVIETLQGKLASPPSRTVMDRLVRMKEVDSVSRMRRLSIKSADSGEEVDEEKPLRVQEERGSCAPISGNELSRKMVHTGAVSKRIISLSENGHITAMGKKKTDRDFCLDSYDPSRVERV